METTTDPSFFQVTIGYVFGDTSVGVSWYKAGDTVNEGSELAAIGVGVGVNYNLPKIGTNVHAAARTVLFSVITNPDYVRSSSFDCRAAQIRARSGAP